MNFGLRYLLILYFFHRSIDRRKKMKITSARKGDVLLWQLYQGHHIGSLCLLFLINGTPEKIPDQQEKGALMYPALSCAPMPFFK